MKKLNKDRDKACAGALLLMMPVQLGSAGRIVFDARIDQDGITGRYFQVTITGNDCIGRVNLSNSKSGPMQSAVWVGGQQGFDGDRTAGNSGTV